VTLVTKEIRVHGKAKAAKSQDEEDETSTLYHMEMKE